MTVEELLLRLEEALKTETEKRKQQEIIEVINKIKNESLYNAAIYDFLTLRFETKLTYKEAYEIPAIRQAFLDSIKNPSLRSTKSNIFLDIVDLFTNKLDVEILKNDEEFNQIIKDITYEQAERLLGGDEVDKIFEDEKYYNLFIKKAEEDNRFYKILPYSSLSINDGTCKLISQHNKGNNKLVKLPGEIQLAILKQIYETTDLSNFLTNFSR